MPRKKGVRVTLLVEDEMTERFAREVLLKLGYHRGEVDEDHDFKHRLKKVDWKQVAQRFVDDFRRTRDQEAVETLSSLNAALEETRRLPT